MPRPKFEILLDTPDLVAINKPPGLATIPGRGETTSALEQLAESLGIPSKGSADPRLRVVHRLDKDTSGVLLFAKHTQAQRHLSHQFQNNTIEKEYLALVAGAPPEREGQVDGKLAPHPTRPREMHVSRLGRPALTLWKLEAKFRIYSLLRVFPKTGKTHQIRVHLRHIGLPLAIDPVYNREAPAILLSAIKRDYSPSQHTERPLINRLTLHAEKLRFVDLAGTKVEIIAPVPKDLRATVNQLSKLGVR